MAERNNYKYTFFTKDIQLSLLATLLCLLTCWFIWIVYFSLFLKYLKKKTITLKGFRDEPVKKIDRRYKVGYKIVGYRRKSYYVDFLAEENDLKRNKRKAYFFLIMAIINLIFAIPLYVILRF